MQGLPTCHQTGKIRIFPLKFLKGKNNPSTIAPTLKNIFFLVKDRERNTDVMYIQYMLFIVYRSEYYFFRLKKGEIYKEDYINQEI